ncbi:hypothetical protein SDJN03_22175, partial [Cucurbita argyrosperma subsp. sororia]
MIGGHTVYISVLTCTINKNRLEALWIENHVGASFVNFSCLPTLFSPGHLKLSRLSDLTKQYSWYKGPLESSNRPSPIGHLAERIYGSRTSISFGDQVSKAPYLCCLEAAK